jgi:uncharacterized protein YbbC (DUF1343 family)
MVKVAYELYPDEFRWKEPPYEYVYDRNPFDVIAGTSRTREVIESGGSVEDLWSWWAPNLEEFKKLREAYLLY